MERNRRDLEKEGRNSQKRRNESSSRMDRTEKRLPKRGTVEAGGTGDSVNRPEEGK